MGLRELREVAEHGQALGVWRDEKEMEIDTGLADDRWAWLTSQSLASPTGPSGRW